MYSNGLFIAGVVTAGLASARPEARLEARRIAVPALPVEPPVGWPSEIPYPPGVSDLPIPGPGLAATFTKSYAKATPKALEPREPTWPLPTFSAPGPGPQVYEYQGCWQNAFNDWVLPSGPFHDFFGTTEGCADHCKGFKYFALEAGHSCYCGNEIGSKSKLSPWNCVIPCIGDVFQRCGGWGAMSVYKYSNLIDGPSSKPSTKSAALESTKVVTLPFPSTEPVSTKIITQPIPPASTSTSRSFVSPSSSSGATSTALTTESWSQHHTHHSTHSWTWSYTHEASTSTHGSSSRATKQPLPSLTSSSSEESSSAPAASSSHGTFSASASWTISKDPETTSVTVGSSSTSRAISTPAASISASTSSAETTPTPTSSSASTGSASLSTTSSVSPSQSSSGVSSTSQSSQSISGTPTSLKTTSLRPPQSYATFGPPTQTGTPYVPYYPSFQCNKFINKFDVTYPGMGLYSGQSPVGDSADGVLHYAGFDYISDSFHQTLLPPPSLPNAIGTGSSIFGAEAAAIYGKNATTWFGLDKIRIACGLNTGFYLGLVETCTFRFTGTRADNSIVTQDFHYTADKVNNGYDACSFDPSKFYALRKVDVEIIEASKPREQVMVLLDDISYGACYMG